MKDEVEQDETPSEVENTDAPSKGDAWTEIERLKQVLRRFRDEGVHALDEI